MALSELKAGIIKESGYQSTMVRGFDVDVEDRGYRGYKATIRLMFDVDSDEMLFLGETSDSSIAELKTAIMEIINSFPSARELIAGHKKGLVTPCFDKSVDPLDNIHLNNKDTELDLNTVQTLSAKQKEQLSYLDVIRLHMYNAIVDNYFFNCPVNLRALALKLSIDNDTAKTIVMDLYLRDLISFNLRDGYIYLLDGNCRPIENTIQYKTADNFKSVFNCGYNTDMVNKQLTFSKDERDIRTSLKCEILYNMKTIYNHVVNHSFKQSDKIDPFLVREAFKISRESFIAAVNALITLGLIKETQTGYRLKQNERCLLCGSLFYDNRADYVDHFLIK